MKSVVDETETAHVEERTCVVSVHLVQLLLTQYSILFWNEIICIYP